MVMTEVDSSFSPAPARSALRSLLQEMQPIKPHLPCEEEVDKPQRQEKQNGRTDLSNTGIASAVENSTSKNRKQLLCRGCGMKFARIVDKKAHVRRGCGNQDLVSTRTSAGGLQRSHGVICVDEPFSGDACEPQLSVGPKSKEKTVNLHAGHLSNGVNRRRRQLLSAGKRLRVEKTAQVRNGCEGRVIEDFVSPSHTEEASRRHSSLVDPQERTTPASGSNCKRELEPRPCDGLSASSQATKDRKQLLCRSCGMKFARIADKKAHVRRGCGREDSTRTPAADLQFPHEGVCKEESFTVDVCEPQSSDGPKSKGRTLTASLHVRRLSNGFKKILPSNNRKQILSYPPAMADGSGTEDMSSARKSMRGLRDGSKPKDNPFYVDLCDADGQNSHHETKKNRRQMLCCDCGIKFARMVDKKAHVRRGCAAKDVTLASKSSRNLSDGSKPKDNPFYVDLCDADLSDGQTNKSHLEANNSPSKNRKQMICRSCGMKFARIVDKKAHVRSGCSAPHDRGSKKRGRIRSRVDGRETLVHEANGQPAPEKSDTVGSHTVFCRLNAETFDRIADRRAHVRAGCGGERPQQCKAVKTVRLRYAGTDEATTKNCESPSKDPVDIPMKDSRNPPHADKDESPHACGHCLSRFKTRSGRFSHERRVHGIPPASVSRERGNDVQASTHSPRPNVSGDNHKQENHTTVRERPYACSHCRIAFQNESALRFHEKYIHAIPVETDQASCMTCDEGVNLSGRPYACRYCPQSFKYRSQRWFHERYVHDIPVAILDVEKRTLPYPCRYCRKMYTQKRSRSSHEKHIHGIRSKKVARKANDAIRSDASLNIVSKNHEKKSPIRKLKCPYACRHCPKKFRKSGFRRRHERNVHKVHVSSAEVPRIGHDGDHASEETSRKRLVGKRRKLGGQKNLLESSSACSYCDKKFIRYISCWRHEKNVHKDRGFTNKMAKNEHDPSSNQSSPPVDLTNDPYVRQSEGDRNTEGLEDSNAVSTIATLIVPLCDDGQGAYLCRFCRQSFTDKSLAIEHERSHVEFGQMLRSMTSLVVPGSDGGNGVEDGQLFSNAEALLTQEGSRDELVEASAISSSPVADEEKHCRFCQETLPDGETLREHVNGHIEEMTAKTCLTIPVASDGEGEVKSEPLGPEELT